MKIFQCNNCGNPVFFENVICQKCGHWLGYLDENQSIYALQPNLENWQLADGRHVKYCKNHGYDVCNWLVMTDANDYCIACQFNQTIPNLQMDAALEKWRHFESAKHRLIYSLRRLQLPLVRKMYAEDDGLWFHFVDKGLEEGDVKMGHANGEITILLSEADSVQREMLRKNLKEPYRTMIGHLRHEVGHYYWDQLVWKSFDRLQEFRSVFGDEQVDYTDSLHTYYNVGPGAHWQGQYISAYATAHPWEDWAETWAHYMHLIDTMETAYHFGLDIEPELRNAEHMYAKATFDPYETQDFKQILDYSIPLFFAMNSINRSMGISDLYPFVISDSVVQKLKFIHDLVRSVKLIQ